MIFFKKIKEGAKARYQEEKLALKQKFAAEKDIRAKARTAALQERRKQAIKSAQYKVKVRAERQRTSYKSNAGGGLATFNKVSTAFVGQPSKKKKDIFDIKI